jgi:hypothetical protein
VLIGCAIITLFGTGSLVLNGDTKVSGRRFTQTTRSECKPVRRNVNDSMGMLYNCMALRKILSIDNKKSPMEITEILIPNHITFANINK